MGYTRLAFPRWSVFLSLHENEEKIYITIITKNDIQHLPYFFAL